MRSRNLFYQFLLSHVLIFAIPFMILSSVVYYNAVVSFKSEIESANLFKLNQLKQSLDVIQSGLDKTASRISIDSLLTPYMVKSDTYSGIEAVEELNQYKESNAIVEEAALYFHGDNRIYSSNGMSSLDTFLKGIYRLNDADGDGLVKQMNELNVPQISRAKTALTENDRSENVLIYNFPIPRNVQSPYGTVVFVIKEAMLTDFVNPILGDFKGSVYISDPDGHILASRTKGIELAEADMLALLAKNEEDGIYNASLGNGNYSMMRTNSELTGWSYVVVMPTNQFLGRVLEMRTFVLVVCSAVIAIGVVIAVLLSRRQYRPIRSIADYIRTLQGSRGDVVYKSNELDLIRHSVEYTRDLIETIDYQRPIVREQLFTRLLNGIVKDTDELTASMARENLIWPGDQYFVAVVSIDQHEYISTQSREELLKAFSAVRLQDAIGYGLEMSMDVAFVLLWNTGCGEHRIREVQEKAAQRIFRIFEQCCGLTPSVGIGNPVKELLQVNRSFIEASAAVESNLRRHAGEVVFFDDISEGQERNEWYPIEEQIRMVQSMKQGNRAAAETAFEAILIDLQNKEVTAFLFRCMCYDLVNTCLRTMHELKMTLPQDRRSRLTESMTLDQLRTGMMGMIDDICSHVESCKESKHHALGEDILRFVQEHYKEYDLNLDRLADQFQMSLSYFSRFMKEQTGYTFTEYVTQLRMEEVKRQLKLSERPIKDIVLDVGYADVSNFMRKFKSAEGITPGQYRKLYS